MATAGFSLRLLWLDFQSDSRCANFRDKPLSAGRLAGWSSPIISHGGEVLGTFGMYFREQEMQKSQTG